MFKKLLVLLVVATLVIPSAALAAGKPDFVENKGDTEQNTYKNNKTERNNYEKGSRTKATGTRATSTKVTKSEEVNVDNDESATARGRTEEMRLRAHQEREEAKQMREEARQKTKEHMKGAGEDKIIDNPEESDEDSNTPTKHRGEGVLKAMEKIAAKIASWEEMGKTPGNALNALKTVVNKFASWFGLESPYQDVDAPGESDEPGSDESTGTPSPDETTPTPSPDETDMPDPTLGEEQNDGSDEDGLISE